MADPSTALRFIVQLALLLTAARALGELARRLGQPAVIGEIVAGILLGPSLLGLLAPGLQAWLFPAEGPSMRMLELMALLGMMLLLLMTGLETDLAVLRNLGRVALYASIAGMVVPFCLGLGAGWAVPERYLVDPAQRLLFMLFLAVALSISAIPVIARILTDLDLMRRNIGVVILGAGVADDTTGWLLLSMIAAVAARGELSVATAALAVASTAAFVGAVYLVGSRLVLALLRWIDDRVAAPYAMTSAIVVITLLFGSVTESIGIHAVFGAFVAGLVVARSPRLRRPTVEQIEGFLIAVFAPIFFAYAGLQVDLTHGFPLGLTLAIVALACAGKLLGVTAGAYLGGLGGWEALAVGSGMNARGAMGLVVALVGLSFGVLSAPMYGVIVMVAIVTTAMTAPLLRWTTRRIPVGPDEAERLRALAERRRALLPQSGPKVLLPTGGGRNAERALALVARLVAGDPSASIVTFHIERRWHRRLLGRSRAREQVSRHLETLNAIARAAGASPLTLRTESGEAGAEVILREAARGYDLLVLGASEVNRRHPLGGQYVQRIAAATPGPLLVVRGAAREPADAGARVLVPVSGSAHARAALELAVLFAARLGGPLIALHVIESSFAFFARTRPAAGRADTRAAAEALLATARERAAAMGVTVHGEAIEAANVERAIVRAAANADLLVLGAAPRPHARRTFFGARVETILADSPCAAAVLVLPQ
jgi:Kef-type K+ transport system membrane component KefB/nucleotide-binding universal stress UspA family protein